MALSLALFYPLPFHLSLLNRLRRMTYFNIWCGGPPSRRTNRPTCAKQNGSPVRFWLCMFLFINIFLTIYLLSCLLNLYFYLQDNFNTCTRSTPTTSAERAICIKQSDNLVALASVEINSTKRTTSLVSSAPVSDVGCVSRNVVTKTLRTVSDRMGFRLFLDVLFSLIAVSNFLTGVYLVPMVFIPNRGLRLGFDSDQSSWLISMVGIANTLGRLLFGLIANVKCVNRVMLYNSWLVIAGLFSVASVALWTFPVHNALCLRLRLHQWYVPAKKK